MLRGSLLALVLSSSAFAQGTTSRDTAFTWSKKLADGARFAIRNLNGGIEVRAGTTDRVEVRAVIRNESSTRASDVGFDVRERAADDVEICTTERGVNACVPEDTWTNRHVPVRYIVDIPKGLRLSFTTGSGFVIVTQSAAEIDAATGSGDVVIRESTGGASATSGNGDVTVAMANGPVRATTGNGRVMVNGALGPVTASSGNGSIEVRLISVTTAHDSMSITSGNGDVRLVLPADFNGEIDATTGHGGIKTDFSVRERSRDSDSRLRGTIGSGVGPVIRINSGNGRVEIRKD
jgi:hypothetical protein